MRHLVPCGSSRGWACAAAGGGPFQLNGSGKPHGVIRFNGAVRSITWAALTNKYWNGSTACACGIAPAPVTDPDTRMLMLAGPGIVLRAGLRRR